mmetsp:Transcript_36920/g.35645  ORF Transcript_36920/g.35645 Transcript_36920/m.35645 type:complete len:108 (-) Transcript_36920:255-578(-)|eukprot:CAMPEP_0170567640 /NCGR_PEP_ID=MMETSP0211-20121228/80610_1 /TAXON_ID=311385 /ORGANISM="Pseudokeronopsis sp., Strain OXSARD2" /LENGTH=107 /DNA_ID=CAMNT_0010889153 /DNA_START=2603 /DNA_END=2926 /DNA_ORIENTATION=-
MSSHFPSVYKNEIASRLQIFYEDDIEENYSNDEFHHEHPSNNQDTNEIEEDLNINVSPTFEILSDEEEENALPSFGNTLTDNFNKDLMGKVNLNNPNRDTVMEIKLP